MVPSTEECKRLWDEFDMPENIRQHSLNVNKAAMQIAEKLKKAGEDIDLGLVNAASLLHDLDKFRTLDDVHNHGHMAESWLKERGYNKVGEVIRKHIVPEIMKDSKAGWEDKVVNYADKRVLNEKIVSLEKRFEYLRKRYRKFFSKDHEDAIIALEDKIFKKMDITPDDII
ncbi:HD domain-containing protein [Candidatus Woesearchaeota archaeon]|nr:HD domain-containing protein [Candidatus Woesearchaeota archaeon]